MIKEKHNFLHVRFYYVFFYAFPYSLVAVAVEILDNVLCKKKTVFYRHNISIELCSGFLFDRGGDRGLHIV